MNSLSAVCSGGPELFAGLTSPVGGLLSTHRLKSFLAVAVNDLRCGSLGPADRKFSVHCVIYA